MQLSLWNKESVTRTHALFDRPRSPLMCKQKRWPAMIVLAGMLDAGSVAHAATDWTIKDLGTFSNTSSAAAGINDSGDVTGYSYKGTYPTSHVFLYKDGVMKDISGAPRWINSGKGINSAGQVVGNNAYTYVAPPYEMTRYPFLYKNGVMTIISDKPGSAEAINTAGQVVGALQTNGCCLDQAFLYEKDTMTFLGTLGGTTSSAVGINNVGQIVGASGTTDNIAEHAFLYSQGKMIDLGTLGGKYSKAWGINDNGEVVGQSWMPDMFTHAFLYSGNQMHDLGTLGGLESIAYAINNAQQVVGISETSTAGSGYAPFLYSDGKMINLSVLPAVTKAGWILIDAVAINNAGQIVGYGSIKNKLHAYLLTPPESKKPVNCNDDRGNKQDPHCAVTNSPFGRVAPAESH